MSGFTNGLFTPKGVLGAALMGLIGAAGMFLIEQIYNDRRRVVLAQDLARLDTQVASMREELEHLKDLQAQFLQKRKSAQAKRVPPKHHARKSSTSGQTDGIDGGKIEAKSAAKLSASYASDTDYNTEYNSAIGTDYDVSSEEFYDMSSDSEKEGQSRKGSAKNGTKKISREVEILATVDACLTNGSEEEVNNSFEMLRDLRAEIATSRNGSSDISNDSLMTDVLWRMGKCCQRKANVCEKNRDENGKKKILFEGIDYCKEAVEKDGENAEAHKWYAILVGMRSDYVGTKDKIQDGAIFREHVQEALRLNPTDASLYHLIGRFKFELSNLSWLERKVASTLFTEVPMSSYEDALQEFEKAEGLCKIDWKENRLLLAKCHIGKGDYATGVQWLDKTVSVPSKTSDDHVAEREAQALLSKYSGYRI